jgi:hypothetical protein
MRGRIQRKWRRCIVQDHCRHEEAKSISIVQIPRHGRAHIELVNVQQMYEYCHQHIKDKPKQHKITQSTPLYILLLFIVRYVTLYREMQLQTSLAATNSCRVAVDDVDERRLQGSTTDEETVNVGLLSKLAAVLLGDTAAVQDTGLLGSLRRDLLLEPLADGGVDLLSLLSGGNLAGTNGPGMR